MNMYYFTYGNFFICASRDSANYSAVSRCYQLKKPCLCEELTLFRYIEDIHDEDKLLMESLFDTDALVSLCIHLPGSCFQEFYGQDSKSVLTIQKILELVSDYLFYL